ncbi:putative protein-synthesizing GTPase [Medicago truncatula]|uniref:Eukaryotic translation initiation factor 5B n=1 Tax=Medicago truncatula TaxID=3880 RepID=A0A396HZ32_MEDTR|nr:putative protein-synthesizing GTPase [Medicago truncatula]
MNKGDTVKPPSNRKPVSCIIGDAYTGKTTLLGCIRGNNSSPHFSAHFPAGDAERRMLVLDNTPFRGLYLCDIAILVVDIMHDDGLHPHTIDLLDLLKLTNKQFILALNKIDMIHDWKTCPNAPFRKALLQQSKDVQDEFHTRLSKFVSQFKTHGLNTDLYYKNETIGGQTFSIVPTSAISGEGIPDMLFLLFKWTQKTMIPKFTYNHEYVQSLRPSRLSVVKPNDDLDYVNKEASESILSRFDTSLEGVCVQASNFHSLEALLKIMKTPGVNIPYAAILAFPARVTPEAWQLAHKLGVKIFISDKMHHLFDQFNRYKDNITHMNNNKDENKKDSADEACVLKIMPNSVFNNKDSIVLGVNILQGILKIGNPICIPSQMNIDIGRIASIENNLKPVYRAEKGQQVFIKIVGSNSEERQKMFGRHFGIDDELLVSHNARRVI